ncbi:hypothetical protein JXJ21_03135 [candidate division KSB1 bacterium]|nr:hypothetical protein [candidate division KSB1 bacterium]
MYALEKSLEDQIRDIKKPKPAIIFPEFNDHRVLSAASQLWDFADIFLPVTQEEFSAFIAAEKITPNAPWEELQSRIHFIDIRNLPELRQIFQQELVALSRGKKWQLDHSTASQWASDPLVFSIMLVRMGYANAILGGLRYTSKEYFSPCLRLLEKERTVFELGLFVLPDEHPAGIFRENIAVFSDVAINPAPDAEALASIAVGTCQIVRDLIPESVLPIINGAIVCYSTKGSGEGASIDIVRNAEKRLAEKLDDLKTKNPRYSTIRIESELQMSVAISAKAAERKIKNLPDHQAAGQANVIIVPNLDFGNSMYHLYAATWQNSLKLLQIGGLYSQALDFSRSSTAEDVVLAAKAMILQHLKRPDFSGWRPVAG